MITTKKTHKGEYKVYRNGIFVGNITNWTESGEWSCFDENNEWVGTLSTKKDALLMCY